MPADDNAPKQQRVILIKPHEHAHRQYPAGSVLTLSAKKAEWLIALRVAKEADDEADPAAAADAAA